MDKHTEIPSINGLFWYFANGKKPEAVSINTEVYGDRKFKGFNGRVQSWLRDGEYLIGPQEPPVK